MRLRVILTVMLLVALAAGAAWWKRESARPQWGEAAYERTKVILSYGPRPPGSKALDAVRSHVREELEAAGWVTAGQAFERRTVRGTVRFENVRARFPAGGADPWEQRVDGLLCAHIDSKFFEHIRFVGADDAASACAAIVEMGKWLAAENPALARRLELVFFDGEEAFGPSITPTDGLYGSRFYAGMWRASDSKPKFGILLDMIGHRNLAIRLPADTPEHLKRAVFAAAAQEQAGGHFGMAAGAIIDDHVPLMHAGIPMVDLIGDFSRSAWWHQAGDNLSILSPDSLEISMRVTMRMLEQLLAE